MPEIAFSPHARAQLTERRLTEEAAIAAIQQPDDLISSRERKVAQKLVEQQGKSYLIRVVYEETTSGIIVITVYRTSKIAKYRRLQ